MQNIGHELTLFVKPERLRRAQFLIIKYFHSTNYAFLKWPGMNNTNFAWSSMLLAHFQCHFESITVSHDEWSNRPQLCPIVSSFYMGLPWWMMFLPWSSKIPYNITQRSGKQEIISIKMTTFSYFLAMMISHRSHNHPTKWNLAR